MRRKYITILLFMGLAILLGSLSAYTVDETEQAVITQFGRVVGEPKTMPGLYFKVPFIQKASFFPKNLLRWDGEPGQIPTLDKTFLWVDSFARWRIHDPVRFFQTVGNVTTAERRLDDILDAAVRNLVTSHRLIETVRNSNRKPETIDEGLETLEYTEKMPTTVSFGRQKITQVVIEQAQPKLEVFGIELVDVKMKRVNYVEEVRQSVYQRMIAERKQIVELIRAQGKGQAREIIGDKERDLKKIRSEAYRSAQEIKGKSDAEATRIYAGAYGIDPDFYSFYKTLDVYRESLANKDTTLVLSTDSEFLKYLKSYSPKRDLAE